MFNNGTLIETLNQYEHTQKTAKKVGKISGTIGFVMMLLFAIILLSAAGETVNVGMFIGIAAVVVILTIFYWQVGKCCVWSYYWLLGKVDAPIALTLTLFVGLYLGLALRAKYHGFDQKIKAQM